MYQKLKSLTTNKELHWTLLFQLSSLLGGVALIKLLAVSLSAAEYGVYAIITSVVSFILMMPFTGLLQGCGRYISIYQMKGQEKEFLNSVIFLILFFTSLYILLGSSFYLLYPLSFEWADKYFTVLLLSISEIIKAMFRTINNANRERKNIAISVFLEFFLKITLIIIIYTFYLASIENVLIVLIFANVVSVFIMYNKYKANISISFFSKKHFYVHFKRIYKFSFPLLIWASFGWLRDMSNRWYLDYFLDKESVALFAMISSLALVAPFALQGVIGSYFIPIIYQRENTQKGFTKIFLSRLLPVLAAVFLIGFVIVYVLKDFIVLLLADDKYLQASWMLPWMFLAYSLYVASIISTYELFAHNQTKKLILSSILPGVVAFVGGYFLIKNFGIEGALYNYILTYASYALLTFYVVAKYTKEKTI